MTKIAGKVLPAQTTARKLPGRQPADRPAERHPEDGRDLLTTSREGRRQALHHVGQQQHPKSSITVREAVELWRQVAKLAEATRSRYENLTTALHHPAPRPPPRPGFLERYYVRWA